MKRARKLTSLLLVLVMVLGLATTALAEEKTYTITINNSAEGHTYEAYQIFTGDLNEVEDGAGNVTNRVLSNIKWGSSVDNFAALGDAAAVAEKLDTNYTGEDKITVDDLLEMITLGSPKAESGGISNPYVISGLAAGYYLVKDQDGSELGEGDAYTEYIIKVVGDVETEPKSDVPVVVKKVKDINDSTDDDMTDWQDSADHDIGDSVPFQLKATLAGNVSSYTTYKVVFHDTLSPGLTYNNDAKVYIINDNENPVDVTDAFDVVYANNALTVSCDDVKDLGAGNSSVITVEYTATLNENAVLGSAGNPNEVYLEYSNNPNKSEEGDNETGNTPKDVVIVFTYKTVVNKVDGEENPLTGAEFTLEKYNKETGEWEAITVVKNDEGTTFTFSGLDDGDYRLTETKTPAGYNTIDPIEFTITAGHVDGDTPYLDALSGDVTSGTATFTAAVNDGSLTTNVVNKAGSTLPETGGMGTTILYVLGSILVLGAVVLLITRRRMNSAER